MRFAVRLSLKSTSSIINEHIRSSVVKGFEGVRFMNVILGLVLASEYVMLRSGANSGDDDYFDS